MKINIRRGKVNLTLAFLFFSQALSAQSGVSGTNWVVFTLVALVVVLFFVAFFSLSDSLIQIEAKKSGIDPESKNLSLFPQFSELFGKSKPLYAQNEYINNLKKGFDIKLEGEAKKSFDEGVRAARFSIKPRNYRNLPPIPRVVVKEGDEVLAGDILFQDKKDERIKYTAPVSGEIVEVRRGAKRSISDVIILADKKMKYKKFRPPDLDSASRNEIVQTLLDSGAWSLLNERPFDLVPEPNSIPANIFVTTFDTAPLAPDLNFVIDGKETFFQKGLDVLNKLTTGGVHLGLDANKDYAPAPAFTDAVGVEKHYFRGKHPSGNVGVQIHHIAPIVGTNKVWTVTVQDVITIGVLFAEGIYNVERTIAITGAELDSNHYVKTYMGANVGDLLKDNLKEGNSRIIAGDVLSGSIIHEDEFLNVHDDQITVVKEGDYYEMFGWLLALKPRPSISSTYPNFLIPDHKFIADTNTHGEKRAFVITGQYESVLPMDIYPQHLMKAIMTGDIERMEGLGINELSEEDLALCEFVCTSKMPLQSILRDGLDMMREQV